MKHLGLLFVSILCTVCLQAQTLMSWDFDTVHPGDTIEGLYEKVPAVKGLGLRLDGFTTRVLRHAEDVRRVGDEFTIQAWVALGDYPWNWCPVISNATKGVKGYRLLIGPHAQASFEVALGEHWVSCTTETHKLPLRKWIHLAATYKAKDKIELYIDGELSNSVDIRDGLTVEPLVARGKTDPLTDCVIGMVEQKQKPSHIHRTWGSVAQFFGLDGIVDEIHVYDKALAASQIKTMAEAVIENEPDIKPRKMPEIQTTGEFGAYYTKLRYYPGWDNIWRVGNDPDIVVCFEDSPVKLVFWRGIRYGASWVSENGNWMTDQSVESWDHGEEYHEGCIEHMQDRHCRFSHVRLIEDSPARKVVHWRYAPVSASDNTLNPDPKTGWECWIDEYYYIYPDASAARKVCWTTGSLGQPRQFQESLPLNHPEQKLSDLLEKDYAYVADYEGRRGVEKFSNETLNDPYTRYTIQRYNFKSQHKPFIFFEPGNTMTLKNAGERSYHRYGVCDHFPVGQARCDGRSSVMGDRPTSSMGFPISDPIVHRGDNHRSYWCGIYGMNAMDMDQLVEFGRSWAHAPELVSLTAAFVSDGYDRSERCYQLHRIPEKKAKKLDFVLKGSKAHPVVNPAFYIHDCDFSQVQVLVNGEPVRDCSIGRKESLDSKDMVVYLPCTSLSETKISIIIK